MNKIILKMKEKGFTYTSLGKRVGISQPAMWSIINGRRKMMNVPVVSRICDVLEMNLFDFYNFLKDQGQ